MALLTKRSVLPFSSSTVPARRSVRNVDTSSYGGRNGMILGPDDGGNQYNPGALIMPGSSSAGGQRQRLIVPDEAPMQSQASPGVEGVSTPSPNKYRPPPGFMNDTIDDNPANKMRPEEMLARLRAGGGKWYQLAKFIFALNNKGYDAPTIDGLTGINPVTQNKMIVAGTVYDSLVGKLAPEVLEFFDQGGEDLLFPFRFLSVDRRVQAASYIVNKRLDPSQCDVLARAMKEWERRPTERSGFTNSPADCMVFKHLRDALECRKQQDMMYYIKLGFQTAETEGARQRLQEVVVEQEEKITELSKAVLQVLKLDPDELGFRAIPQVGSLSTATAVQVLSAPRSSASGPFGAFTLSDSATSCAWVALPQWRALALAKHPVALSVEDCCMVPSIVQGTRSGGQAPEDSKRLSGPGLLVVDIKGEGEIEEEQFYLAQGNRGEALLIDGATAINSNVPLLAQVLFLARPPTRVSVAASATDLLSL